MRTPLTVPHNDLVVGLDIGTTKVCAVVAEVMDRAEVLISGVGVTPCNGLKAGVVVDMRATTRAVSEAAGAAAQQAGRSLASAYLGVTGEHIASLNSTARIAITNSSREVTPADVERVQEAARIIVLPPDRRIIHAMPRTYALDGRTGIRDPVGMIGSRLEVQTHIVHGAISFLQNAEKCANEAGLQVTEVVLEPVATAASVLSTSEKDLGICLLDIGGGTTDLAVFVGGAIYYSAVIPIGGAHVTNDVAYGLAVSHAEAERLKTTSGVARKDLVRDDEAVTVKPLAAGVPYSLPRRKLAEIIEPRMVELFQFVRDELDKAGCSLKIPAGLTLTGGGSELVGCVEVARSVLGLPVRIGRPVALGGLGETLAHPAYATAVGLVQYGVEEEERERSAADAPARAGTGAARRFLYRAREWLGL